MSLISKKSFILDEEENQEREEYILPTLVITKPEVIPVKKSLTIAAALHPAAAALIWLITFILLFLGIDIHRFKKPIITPKKDIEFVLVDKPGTPRDPNTKNRSDISSRSGGINDPTRKVSMPSPAPKKQQKPSAAAANANKLIKKQQQKQQTQTVKKPVQQQTPQQVQQPKVQQPTPAKPAPAKPAPPTARPSAKPMSTTAPAAKPSTPFAIPAPKGAPVGKSLATGPIGGTSAPTGTAKSSSGSSSGGSGGSGAYAPRPSLSPSAGSGGNGQLSRGSNAGGTGNVGNPGGGGGAPGIDALREPDFGPYMRELQRRIKLNWDPPKGNESKTVVLLFKIAKDGRLLSSKVHRSSGLPSADQAALKAVELTAPFRPLPADFKGQSIDIQFTFDYRVFGASRY